MRKVDSLILNLEQVTSKLVDALHSDRQVEINERRGCAVAGPMKFKRRIQDEPSINLTPLIDVVFLLLIFFMVTTTFTRETRLQVNLPEAEAETLPSQSERLRSRCPAMVLSL